MNDRDLGTPILFLRIRPNEIIHIRGRLVVETKTASQVCTATSMWHIDEDRAKEDKREFVEDDEGNPVLFDKFYNQRSYSRDENGRPDWFDLNVESVGVIPAKQLVKMSAGVLRGLVDSYVKEALNSIERQKDGEYRIQIKQGGHTVCALLQEVIYTNIISFNNIWKCLEGDRGFFILVVVKLLYWFRERGIGGIGKTPYEYSTYILYPIHSILLGKSLSIQHVLPRNNGKTSI
jgi:hypothetical protein